MYSHGTFLWLKIGIHRNWWYYLLEFILLMAYGKSKDLVKRTQSDKVLRDKAFKIASDPKYDGYQRGLAPMVYKFLIKSLVEVVLLMNQIIS